jgi:hypothetical protein
MYWRSPSRQNDECVLHCLQPGALAHLVLARRVRGHRLNEAAQVEFESKL